MSQYVIVNTGDAVEARFYGIVVVMPNFGADRSGFESQPVGVENAPPCYIGCKPKETILKHINIKLPQSHVYNTLCPQKFKDKIEFKRGN